MLLRRSRFLWPRTTSRLAFPTSRTIVSRVPKHSRDPIARISPAPAVATCRLGSSPPCLRLWRHAGRRGPSGSLRQHTGHCDLPNVPTSESTHAVRPVCKLAPTVSTMLCQTPSKALFHRLLRCDHTRRPTVTSQTAVSRRGARPGSSVAAARGRQSTEV